MAEVKRIETNILKNIDDYCSRHGLRYVVDYGTLLGVIRHKGFIPWDDDIDIVMPREDYEKLIRLSEQEPIGEFITLHYNKATHGEVPYIKAEDDRTIVIAENRLPKYHRGIWVDIFPVDGKASDAKELASMYRRVRRLDMLRTLSVNCHPGKKSAVKRRVKGIYTTCVSPYMFLPVIKHISSRYSFDCAESGTIYFAFNPSTAQFPKDYFEEPIEADFEDIKVRIPKCWDKRLTSVYGDYMQLPPEDQRIGHGMNAYWKES